MKLALLNPTVLIRRPIMELAQHLVHQDYEIHILTPYDQNSKWVPAHFENSDINITYLPSKEFRSIIWSIPRLKSYKVIWDMMKKVDVIQIWAPYYIICILPLIYSIFLGKSSPKIILTFDTIPSYSFKFDSFLDPLMKIYHNLLGFWLIKKATVKTLYSKQLIPFTKKARLRNNFRVIPTGINLAPPREPQPKQGMLEVLFIGLLNSRKGVAILIDALSILKQRGVHFFANIIGEGSGRKEYENLSSTLKLDNYLKFFGRVTNVKDYYKKAHVLVLPSFGEGLPGVVMEAMNYSVPVISTDIPCLRDLIPNSDTGILIPPGDSVALADAIQRLDNNESYRLRLARTGKEYIELFSWKNVIPQYDQLYKSL